MRKCNSHLQKQPKTCIKTPVFQYSATVSDVPKNAEFKLTFYLQSLKLFNATILQHLLTRISLKCTKKSRKMPVLAMENEMYSKPKDDCAVSVCHIYESLEEISRGNLCNILGEPGLPPKAPTPLLKRPEKRYQNSLFSISKRAKRVTDFIFQLALFKG